MVVVMNKKRMNEWMNCFAFFFIVMVDVASVFSKNNFLDYLHSFIDGILGTFHCFCKLN